MKTITDKVESLNDLVQVEEQGVPVLVQPESMLDTNQMASAGLALNMVIGPDDVSVA